MRIELSIKTDYLPNWGVFEGIRELIQNGRDAEVEFNAPLEVRHNEKIWQHSVAEREDLVSKYLDMLEDNTADVAYVDSYCAGNLPKTVKEQAAARFTERHGEDAVPVETLSDSKDMEHLGKKGIVTPNKPLRAVLEAMFGSVYQIKSELANEVTGYHGWSDLTPEEQANLEGAIKLVNAVEPVTIDDVDVADFRSEEVEGMFKSGRIIVAKNKLTDRDKTLEIVVHEVAHRQGGDGYHSHVTRIEQIWSAIVANLRNAQQN